MDVCYFPDGKMHGVGIEFADFPAPHSGQNIAKKVMDTIDQYELHGNIIGIVLDNAKANDNAMEILAHYLNLNQFTFPTKEDFHIRCFGHALNLACKGNKIMLNIYFK